MRRVTAADGRVGGVPTCGEDLRARRPRSRDDLQRLPAGSRDALGEPAAEAAEALEREVEAVADRVALGHLERALADRACGVLVAVEGDDDAAGHSATSCDPSLFAYEPA